MTHTTKNSMLSNADFYKIYRKHVASDGLIDMMDMGQFLDAAREIMRIVEATHIETTATNHAWRMVP